jgi:hypothetical protein
LALAAFVVVGALGLIGWRFDFLGVRTASPVSSVATAFDPPPGPPGYAWTRNGRPVSGLELATFAGPDHCDSGSATYLIIGWPPGTVAPTASEARLYIRDQYGVMLDARYQRLLEPRATLPSDATPTGYRYGSIEIYLSPSDQDEAIYVVGPSSAERWPRSDPMAFCV